VVWIADVKRLDRAVKASFSRVKADINSLKRSLNKQLFEIESLSKKTGVLTTKEEFYSFVKNLGNKLDQMEQLFADRKLLEMHKEEFLARLEALRNELRRQADTGKELKIVRKVRRGLYDLEAKIIDKDQFKKEIKQLDNKLFGLKQQVRGLERTRDKVKELSKLRRSVEQLEKNFVSWKEFFKKTKDIREVLEINQESLAEVRREIGEVRKARVSTREFEKTLKGMGDLLKKLNNQVKSLEEKLVTKQKIKEIETSLRDIKKLKERPVAEKDLKSIKEDINYITQNIVTQADLSARLSSFEEELDDIKKDVKSLKARKIPDFGDFAIKLEEPLEEEIAAKPGFITRFLSKMYDFFKEEEEPAEKVEELIKEEEEKEEVKEEPKERPPFVKYVFIALLLIVVVGGGYIAFSKLRAPTAAITTNITNITLYQDKQKECILTYECQPHENQTWYDCYFDEEDQKCHCFLGEEEKCHPEKVAAYAEKPGIISRITDFILGHKLLTGVTILIIIILVFIVLWRGGEEAPEEETVDLEEFFKEKEEKEEKEPSRSGKGDGERQGKEKGSTQKGKKEVKRS
jgi:chromosome segregation ATPase